MHWVLHGNVSDEAAEVLRQLGHVTHKMDELELPAEALGAELLQAAHSRQWNLLTTDRTLVSAIYEQRIASPFTIVFLQLTGESIEQADAIERLFERYKRLSGGRLYTVTASRVKIRQLPGSR